jgi:serine/threonine-protein kinase HipA
MNYSSADIIEVFAWNRLVGAVALDPATGYYAFEYDDDWVASGADLAPLHMPRLSGVYLFPDLSPSTFYRLPAMLADSLPDRFGNALVNAWMAEHGIDPTQITALDRLAYASARAMGALTFAPPLGPAGAEASLVQVADLVTAARSEIAGVLHDPENGSARKESLISAGNEDVHDALAQLITVGSTAGGARAKAVIAYNPVTGQMRSGQLSAPEGYEQWLLKLDGAGDPTDRPTDPLVTSEQYCRVEYAYYLMAIQAGVEMSLSQLLPEGPRAHFMTRRFDRGPNNERIHSQTLCAMAHLDYRMARTHSYSSYFLTARELGLGPAARQQMFRRVVFNVMGVNRDDHTKNFSFLLSERGEWRLAPAYDITHSYWDGEWTQSHQMSVNGRFVGITLDDLRTIGDLHDVPGIEVVLREVTDAVTAWPDHAAAAGVDLGTIAKIATDIAAFRPG